MSPTEASVVWFCFGPFPWCKHLFFGMFFFFLSPASSCQHLKSPSQPYPFQLLSWAPGRGVVSVSHTRGTTACACVCIPAKPALVHICASRASQKKNKKNTKKPNEVGEATKTRSVRVPHRLPFTPLSKHTVETSRQSAEGKRKHTNHAHGVSNGKSLCFTLGRVE